MITVGSLFAGIGGIDKGLENTGGFRTVWQVEIDPFARRVLEKHWPDVQRWDDVRTFPPEPTDEWLCDLICGGFPCQDLSLAGLGAGILQGVRSGLWFEYSRIIRLLQPKFVLLENVSALLVRGFGLILRDLFESGYDAEWQVVRASDFALPHRRERLFVVAYSDKMYGAEGMGTNTLRPLEIFPASARQRLPIRVQTADQFIGVDDGIHGMVYRDRGSCLGNAVVPAVAQWIGERILEAEASMRCEEE
jgi:DNA (cytosine-5)-methyltransferase 1